jgi:hypothetical protein
MVVAIDSFSLNSQSVRANLLTLIERESTICARALSIKLLKVNVRVVPVVLEAQLAPKYLCIVTRVTLKRKFVL